MKTRSIMSDLHLAVKFWVLLCLIFINMPTYAQVSSTCLSKTKPSGVYTGKASGGGVWGNNTSGLTYDSDIGVALVHAGLLQPGASAYVTITSTDTLPFFTGTTANGITTTSYGSPWCGMVLSLGDTPPPQPSLTVQPSGAQTQVAGQTFTVDWSSTNATSVLFSCTASGKGYAGNTVLPASGSSTTVANTAWIGNPSTCNWIAVGPGGAQTFTQTFTTNNAPGGISEACLSQTRASGRFTGALTGGGVWGNNVTGYTADSNMSVSLVHAGLGTPGQAVDIIITPLDKVPSFAGTTANGVTTSSYGSPWCAMQLSKGKLALVSPRPNAILTAPTNNTKVLAGTSILLEAAAGVTANGASIAKVEFWANDVLVGSASQAPFAIGWTPAAGNYSVLAKAVDSFGSIGSSAAADITVIAGDNPPSVALVQPTDGVQLTSPATLQLTATASSQSGGPIAQVAFYDGTNLLATVSQPPYEITYPNVGPGTYNIVARATDDLGQVSTSAVARVTVSGAKSAGIYYIYTDHLDTPRVITDSSNNAVWSWGNDNPFGDNTAQAAPGFEFNLRFPGQYFDRETNLHYNYYRDYDPVTGRYIQSDPIGLEGGINTYSYVLNQPTRYIDLDGLEAMPVPGIPGLPPIIVPTTTPGGRRGGYDPKTDTYTPPPSPSFLPEWVRDLIDGPILAKPPANAYDPNGPKAPGKPTEADGFKDPKNGENWVPNPNPGKGGSSHGWQDANGDVWCPTGPGGRGHGGPHWDVQTPGGGYRNVRPQRK